jgi:hypothetical protein
VTGVILTGLQDDGVAGLAEIKRKGGVAVVRVVCLARSAQTAGETSARLSSLFFKGGLIVCEFDRTDRMLATITGGGGGWG